MTKPHPDQITPGVGDTGKPSPETFLDIVESRTYANGPDRPGGDGLLPLQDLPMYRQGRATALSLLNDRRVVPDERTKQEIETYEECARELRAALAATSPTRDGAEGAGSIAMSCCATDEQIAAHVADQAALPKPAADTMREALERMRESCARIAQPWPDSDPQSQTETDKTIIDVRKRIAETIRAELLPVLSAAPVPQADGAERTFIITQTDMDVLHGAAHSGAMLGGNSAYEGCLKVEARLAAIASRSPSGAVAASPGKIPPHIAKAINDLSDYADDLDATERPATGEYDVTKDIRRVCQALIDALMFQADEVRLIAMMALAMQTAQGALRDANNSPDALAAALSSLTIALDMEAAHWQKYARQALHSNKEEK